MIHETGHLATAQKKLEQIVAGTLRVPSAVHGTRSVPSTLELNNLFLRGRFGYDVERGSAMVCYNKSRTAKLLESIA